MVQLPPTREILARLFLRGGIQAQNGASLQHLLAHEVFERRHFDGLGRNLVSHCSRNDHNALAVPDNHIARPDRGITAANGNIDVKRLMPSQICRS